MPLSDFADIYSIRSIKPSATNKHGRPNKLAIVDRRRGVVEVRARDFLRAANSQIASLPQPVPIIWSSFLVGKREGDQLQFDGVGMGHGVGLCQYGAQELAGRGKSFEDILSWYYPGADLHTIST
jgi:stage II sporulation protein D